MNYDDYLMFCVNQVLFRKQVATYTTAHDTSSSNSRDRTSNYECSRCRCCTAYSRANFEEKDGY